MSQKISEYFGLDPAVLEKEGAFDAFVNIDTRLFLDPHLLTDIKIEEFKHSYQKIENHFASIIRLIKASKEKGDLAWKAASERLRFQEMRGISIGHSKNRSDGHGIGPKLKNLLLTRAKEIIDLGVNDPEIFELIGLISENFGADLLSDMTIHIIREDLYLYSEKLARNFGLKQDYKVNIGSKTYYLATHPNGAKPLIFIPKRLLKPLPIADSRDDIQRITQLNSKLRVSLNGLIARVWKSTVKSSARKEAIRKHFLSNPQDFHELIKSLRGYQTDEYDFHKDPEGQLVWYPDAQKIAKTSPLTISLKNDPKIEDLEDLVYKIIAHYKKLIETNSLYKLLYTIKNGTYKPRTEYYSQLLFYGVSDIYCQQNNIDINREPNAGSGPVDFKYSKGYLLRLLVEVKLSSNKNLLKGYQKQLPAYQESETSLRGVYLVMKLSSKHNEKIQELLNLEDQAKLQHPNAPKVIVIDATPKQTASKR